MRSKNKIPTELAAKLMGISPQSLRVGLQNGRFPFGYAIKTSSIHTYYISPVKFTECTGIKLDDIL